jgi:hypothetical protein
MTTFGHLFQYIAKSFLAGEMFHIKVTYKIKTHISRSVTPPPTTKIVCHSSDNVEKYGGAGDDNIVRRMRLAS